MTKNYFATGIISKSTNFGEADSIFHLITKEYGLVKAVAKSVRKPKSKLKGHLQTLNHVNAYLRKGKNLDLITQVESINSFNSIKKMLLIVNFSVKSPNLECWNALRKIIFGELCLGTV